MAHDAQNNHREGEGVLYVVATPIGNPGDITVRALEVLRDADLIACEDTRRAGVMLASHQIKKPLLSYFEHNEDRRVPDLIERLQAGARIALISDAGTPAISDPGYRLVRAAHEAGIRVAAVPGASAAIAALSISGISTNRFAFEGFLPSRDSARRSALEALRRESRTMIFYEAARRLGDSLSVMAKIFGADRGAAVVREITKTHEETVRGTLAELAQQFTRDQALGEIAIVLEGAPSKDVASDGAHSNLTVEDLTEAGLSLKQASALIAKLTGASRRDIYNQALKLRREPN
ncbi:MAG TPA: 16S rRNA (cytidine(1402)-2'-O)-methyltransferase [Candidatus Binataceae bacterium]|nr:16S rRNA (cytidine(1402)-2'-O)-methyltransferase [Candidatus Binataceae bacterium]